jgi:quinol monooxygenase YgiN
MRRPFLIAIVVWGSFVASLAAEPPADEKLQEGFSDLIAALKATPGCLGIDTAKTESGKLVIFAWFEDKKAALKWYHSDVHQAVIKKFFPNRKLRDNPLAGVPDDGSPVMAVASVTVNEERTKENPRPFKQIAIELYKPLPGGLSLGGRFAPDKMKVPAAGAPAK